VEKKHKTTPTPVSPGGDGTEQQVSQNEAAKKQVEDSLGAMCADSSLTADQQKICKDCLASKYIEGQDYTTQEKYDAIVGEIQTCFADKSRSGVTTTDICEEAGLDAETKALCKSCQGKVTDPQNVEQVAACIQASPAAGVTDICEESGLDAATKALCKTCQGKVTDPQSVEQVAACIQASAGTTTPVFGATSPCDDPAAQLTDEQYVACVSCYSDGMTIEVLEDCIIEKVAKSTGTVPVCDSNDPSFNLATCMGKICDPADALYNQESCDYLQGTVEQPYYPQGETVIDTMDPCDTTSQMYDATACSEQGGTVYTSAVQAEPAPSPFVPVAVVGAAMALIFMGFRNNGKPPAKK